MLKFCCKTIHLRLIISTLLCIAAVSSKRLPATAAAVSPQSAPSGLANVTNDFPRPDFDVEVRSAEEMQLVDELQNVTQPTRKKKKKKTKTPQNPALKRALKEAARKGMEAMVELYDTLEPTLKQKGEVLRPDEPGAQLSMFSAPNLLADDHDQRNRAAYAALYAAKKLKESYDVDYLGLGRQTQTRLSLRRTALESLCPPRDSPRCLPASKRYRTHDGTCNNERRTRWGSAQMPFHRFLQPDYSDGVENFRLSDDGGELPSARFVSLVVHGARADEAPVTLMLAQWGQFIDHDLTATAQPRSINGSVPRCCGSGEIHPNCAIIRVPIDDPWLSPLNVRCLEFLRSAPAQRIDCVLSWREQLNQATSYLDASTVYASNPRTADSNRIFRDGKLIFGRGTPRDDVCLRGALAAHCVRAGDQRSGEQPGLMAMHTAWVAEHNRIAGELGRLNAHWSDEKLYQEARRIVGAMVQHITYREFLPLVLGREVCRLFELTLETSGYFNGYDPSVNPTVANSFGAAAFRFGHSLVQGSLMRSDRNNRFMLTNVTLHEEFGKGDMGGPGSLHRLLRGMLMQRAMKRDEFISAELTNHLFQSNSFPFGLDLAAINIQRGRDHGLPSYTSWRVPCGLSPINDWRDLVPVLGPESTDRIRQAYRSVNDIDLFVGGLAERPVVGGLVGPTFACIIAQQFGNLRKGDRFWYENGGFESSFTPAQLASLRQVTLAQVLCRQVNGGTMQPHAFLPPDMTGNERQFCGELSLIPLDLIPWTERDPLNKQHDLPLRLTTLPQKPQLMPNNHNSATNNSNKNKNKNKKTKRKRKKPPVVAKEDVPNGVETKLDDETLLLTKPINVTKNEAVVANKLDRLDAQTTKKSDKLKLTSTTLNDKLDFEEGRTTLSTDRSVEQIESRSIVGNAESKTIPLVQWQKKDPNTLHIAITWNGVQAAESKPLAPTLHDKISSVDDEIHFIPGTGGSFTVRPPIRPMQTPAPAINSPFSYDPHSKPMTMQNNYGPMTFWTANDVPIVNRPQNVFDNRNTITMRPRPVAYRPQLTYYPMTMTTQQNHFNSGGSNSKPPTFIYSSYKLATGKVSPAAQTPFSSLVANSPMESKTLPSESEDNLKRPQDESTELSSTDYSPTTPSPDSTTFHSQTDSTDPSLDYTDDDDYDSSTVYPPVLIMTDNDSELLVTSDEWDRATQFDKDGYLRPDHMNFHELTLDADEKLNKDFKTVQLEDSLLNLTEPRRPALSIVSDLELSTNHENNNDEKDEDGKTDNKGINDNKKETIAFVPLKILNSDDRPDDWWMQEGEEKTPLPLVPEIAPGSRVSVELPKPMRLL